MATTALQSPSQVQQTATVNSAHSNHHQQNRARRGGKSRGRGGRGGNRGEIKDEKAAPAKEDNTNEEQAAVVESLDVSDGNTEDGDVCWICAEPVKYYSLSACNHRTCHVCALRLRALYKKDVCTFCKEPQLEIIFTTSPDTPFSDYSLPVDKPKFYDAKLRITFESQEMMTEALILLRFNCPDSECDYIAKGWGDLKMHVRAGHGRVMCDLCIRSKKVFAHEHILYTYQQLRVHLPSMDYSQGGRQRSGKKPNTNQPPPEGGIHPLCEFCRECHFSEDELYGHMRERHEECFICKREGVRDMYFASYPSLEAHFNTAHHPCTHPTCLERKFVVFGSALDLQAHMVEEHGVKDRRVVGLEFVQSNRQRERDPPPRQQPQPLPPPAPPQNQSRRRQAFGGALTSGGDDSTLTNADTPTLSTPAGPSRRASPNVESEVDPAVVERHASFLSLLSSLSPNPTSALPAVQAATRSYRAGESSARDLITIVRSVLDRDKMNGDSSVSNKDTLELTARVINAVVDLLEDEEEHEGVEDNDKKSLELLREWKGFEVEQRRQFPDFYPTAVSSSSGAGAYAAITSGRVLNAKHSTHTSANAPGVSTSKRGQVWDRVAQAATGSRMSPTAVSSSRGGPVINSNVPGSMAAVTARANAEREKFPPLGGGSAQPNTVQGGGGRKTPWTGVSGSGNGTNTPSTPTSSPASSFPGLPSSSAPAPTFRPFSVPASSMPSKNRTSAPPPKLNPAAFPGLPTSANRREKVQVKGNVSLRNILGTTGEVPASRWGPSTQSGSGSPATTPGVAETGGELGESGEAGTGEGGGEEGSGVGTGVKKGKGGKGKMKQKQMLFTLGSFPS